MKRVVSVWLPHWPIERLKRTETNTYTPLSDKAFSNNKISNVVPLNDVPFALIDMTRKGPALFALNQTAYNLKLYRGQRLTDARAMVPKLLTAPAQPEEDARALKALVRWCIRYSPFLNRDGEDALWIEISTTAHLFGGEKELLRDIHQKLSSFGITARLGLADTLGAAWALARHTTDHPKAHKNSYLYDTLLKQRIASPGKLSRYLSDYPVSSLRLNDPTIQLLKRLGLRRIGQLTDLPRFTLKRRFPSKDIADAVLMRLDQALGRVDEPRESLLPITRYIARAGFTEPLISSDGVETVLRSLCHELCAQLTRNFQGGRQIVFTIYRTDGSSASAEIGTSTPTNDPAHISRLLDSKIENLDAGFGIDQITLAARVYEPLKPIQSSFSQSDRKEQEGTSLLIDRLANRLGKDRVYRMVSRESHIPERAQSRVPAVIAIRSWEQPDRALARRPLFILPVPEKIKVIAEIPDGPPKRFTWRRITRGILRAEGPERLTPEWWHAISSNFSQNSEFPSGTFFSEDYCTAQEDWESSEQRMNKVTGDRVRDYYFIEDEIGERYWIYRAGLYDSFPADMAPQWYLQGFFA